MILSLHSYFSLRYGTLSPDRLIEQLAIHNFDTAVLTDINNSSASLDFVKRCQKSGIRALTGIDFRNENKQLYVGIAKNKSGFKELNDFLTRHNLTKTPFPERAPEFENSFIIYPYREISESELKPHEYIGIRPQEVGRFIFSGKNASRFVAFNQVSFDREDFLLHKQLRAIDNNILISQLKPQQTGSSNEVFRPRSDFLKIYEAEPVLLKNAEKLLESCSFDFDFNTSRNKKTFTGNPYDDKELLYKYTMNGLEKRYGKNNKEAEKRVLNELEIINKLHFSSYFLITDDICRYARSRDFRYVGRGSGANSIVAYCLEITEVCPVELNLYFERFLNPKRRNPPDFDIDFSWKNRDDIYDYIFKRYQSDHTALMGAVSTFKNRSTLRELGKIYGLPKPEIDRLIQDPENMLNKNEIVDTVLKSYQQLLGFPNQRTIHASGVLISEEPLTSYSALDFPPKGLPTVQYDMYLAEEIGFEKFDILSQRGIGHIKDCREIIRANRDIKTEIPDSRELFKDPRIAAQLRSAETIGCFYIESPAMRQLLHKLQCDDYLTLVAASSIIRPGVASSGMMQTFIERHHHPEKVTYLHPVFEEQLKETYGVMVYQEDVMKIGHHFGGLDLADADVLRRMMSGKYRSKNHLTEIEDTYYENCRKKGYPENLAKEVWRQMESFAGYSFNKAHSASFAVESYQSLYFKTYFPLEFMVSVLNNYGGFYSREVYVHEAGRAGAHIELPCVNRSDFNTSISGTTIFLGFDCIAGLEIKQAHKIPEERQKNGDYTSLEEFMTRTRTGLEQVLVLIRTGAFRFLKTGKKELLWQAHLLHRKTPVLQSEQLFENPVFKPDLPEFKTNILEDLYDEIELLGFPVSGTMFDLLRSSYRGNATAQTLSLFQNRTVRTVAVLVTAKTVRTKNGKLMKFGTFIDQNGDFINTVHFPQSLKKYPLRGKGVYLLEGNVQVDFGEPAIEVKRCGLMPLKPDPRSE